LRGLAVWYDDPIIVTLVLLVVIIAVGTVIFAMRRYGKSPSPEKKQKQPEKKPKADFDPEYNPMPFKVSKSIQTTMASDAKNELRTLDLERDILGDALRRLYEAHAEGKITEQERDKMAITYKNRMNLIKESISKDESIVALHELEGMQEDLMKLFSERFGELTSKVEELRGRIDVKPIREIPIKMPSQTPLQMEEEDEEEEEQEKSEAPAGGEEKPKKKRKPPEERPSQKTEAEKRIESIQAEVEKVLDKLGQMEIES
jgi:flagellar basal body-associated protein FliL